MMLSHYCGVFLYLEVQQRCPKVSPIPQLWKAPLAAVVRTIVFGSIERGLGYA